MTADWRARLQRAIKDHDTTMKALSLEAEAGETYVRDILMRDREPALDKFSRIAKALGMSVSQLLGDDTGASPEVLPVPVYDVRASAGYGAIANDEPPEHFLFFRQEWLHQVSRNVSQLMVLEISGDSMWDTLHDGDHALVDRSQADVRHEGLFVIRIDDVLQVKRISMHPVTKLLIIKSDNPAYPTYPDISPSDINVVGRVIWIGRSLG